MTSAMDIKPGFVFVYNFETSSRDDYFFEEEKQFKHFFTIETNERNINFTFDALVEIINIISIKNDHRGNNYGVTNIWMKLKILKILPKQERD